MKAASGHVVCAVRTQYSMRAGQIVATAAWFEIGVGGIILADVAVPSRLFFAAVPQGVAVPLARFAGIALVALGIACLPSTGTGPRRSSMIGLLVFNVGVAILFAEVAINTALRGPLLWPAIIVHAIIAVALLSLLLIAPSHPS